jgi:hypothetical protein
MQRSPHESALPQLSCLVQFAGSNVMSGLREIQVNTGREAMPEQAAPTTTISGSGHKGGARAIDGGDAGLLGLHCICSHTADVGPA